MDNRELIDDLVRQMAELDASDPEMAHGEADDMMLRALRALGAGDLANAFESASDRIGFWYA